MTNEAYRGLVARAIEWGRQRQSPQTSFLHYQPGPNVENRHDTIPLVENLLFCLALLRSKEMEKVQEAKDLFLKLMPFQNAETGNFPRYIHEYPLCPSRFMGVEILPILIAIRLDFGHVLGDEVGHALETAGERLLALLEREKKIGDIPGSLKWQVEASSALWRGRAIPLWTEEISGCLHSRELMRVILLAQMEDLPLEQGAGKEVWSRLLTWFHRGLQQYAGPALYERQDELYPDGHLVEPAMAVWLGTERISKLPRIGDLQAMVLRPRQPNIPSMDYPFLEEGAREGKGWQLALAKDYAVFAMAYRPPCPPSIVRGCHVLRLLWGDPLNLHSLVSQPAPDVATDFVWHEGRGTWLFELPMDDGWEEKGKNREVSLFLSRHPDLIIKVAGNQSTTFQLGEELLLQSPERSVRLTFSLAKGRGNFFGHIAHGNRPAQLDRAGEKRFDAFDWHLFLRTVNRSGPCTLKLDVEIDH